MRRREVIAVLAGAAATRPLRARAQQPESPVIGFLSSISEEPDILHGVPPWPCSKRLSSRDGM